MYISPLGICFRVDASIHFNKFFRSLPCLTFIFEMGAKYIWKPESYLFNNTRGNETSFCIGVTSWNSNEILLGTTWMHDHDIIFDVLNKRIGFVSSSCDGVSRGNYTENNIESNCILHSEFDKNKYSADNQNTSYYKFLIIILSILVVVITVALLLIICRIRRRNNFFWSKLENEVTGKKNFFIK